MNFRTLSTLTVLTFIVGCGGSEVDLGPTGTVSGSLSLDGSPLTAETQVTFIEPAKGHSISGYTDAEGNFTATSWNNGNLPVGTYKVMVHPPAPKPLTPEEELNNTGEQETALPFPEMYADHKTSGLSYDIKTGGNTFKIELTSGK